LGDDHKLAKFESSADHLYAERSDVVLVRVADLFDEAMRSESFEQARHLAAAALRQMAAQRFVLQPLMLNSPRTMEQVPETAKAAAFRESIRAQRRFPLSASTEQSNLWIPELPFPVAMNVPLTRSSASSVSFRFVLRNTMFVDPKRAEAPSRMWSRHIFKASSAAIRALAGTMVAENPTRRTSNLHISISQER
jgi:hypothetical protein